MKDGFLLQNGHDTIQTYSDDNATPHYGGFEPPCSFIFAKCFAPQHALLVFTIDPVEAWIDRYSLEGAF